MYKQKIHHEKRITQMRRERDYKYFGYDEKTNSKGNLIGFAENKVYDLDNGTLRETRDDDYVTFSTNYAFPSFNQEVHDELFAYLESTGANVEEILEMLTHCLHGDKFENGNKPLVWVLLGKYQSGRTTFLHLVKRLFGDYNENNMIHMRELASNKRVKTIAWLRGARVCVPISNYVFYYTDPKKRKKVLDKLGSEFCSSKDQGHPVRFLCEQPFTLIPQFDIIIDCDEPLERLSPASRKAHQDQFDFDHVRVVRFPYHFYTDTGCARNPLIDTKMVKEKKYQLKFQMRGDAWGLELAKQLLLVLLERHAMRVPLGDL